VVTMTVTWPWRVGGEVKRLGSAQTRSKVWPLGHGRGLYTRAEGIDGGEAQQGQGRAYSSVQGARVHESLA
jgi:hypothetical protein